MTELWTEGEQIAAISYATVANAAPNLRTYSERRRHSRYASGSCVCYDAPVQQYQANAGCRRSADESNLLTAVLTPQSTPISSRPSQHKPFHPFFSRCSLQAQNPTQHKPSKRSFTQLHLDAGQANFACITCNVCGLIYAKGEANDEKVHAAFHASYTQGVKFQGWHHERVLGWDGRQGRILLVLPTDATSHLKKVKEVCAVIEEHLGLCKGWLTASPCQVYLYVSSSKHVLGCVIAERITSAFPVVPPLHTCASASTATSMHHLGTDSPPTPMSAPPFAKHQRLSCLGSAHSAASSVPPLSISEKGAGSQHENGDTETAQSGLAMASAPSPKNPHASIGSSSSSQAIAHVGKANSGTHHRHLGRPNLLTRWLATSQGKKATAQATPARPCISSPESAGSVAASRQAGGCSAARLQRSNGDISSAVPTMPFTDITNDSRTCQASNAEALCACLEGQAACFQQGCALSGSCLQQQTASDAEGFRAGQPACASQPAGQCGNPASLPQQPVLDIAMTSDTASDMATNMLQDEQRLENASHHTGQIRSPADELGQSKLGWGEGTHAADTLACRPWPSARQQTVTIDRTKPVKAVCGIKVMWVSAHARRRKIATQLLDMARCNCVAGLVIPRSQLAFSQPTQSGRCLAEQYTQSRSFLVYQ